MKACWLDSLCFDEMGHIVKRDMELIRKILVAIEDYPHATDTIPLQFEEYCDTDVSYHIKLLADQGLIEATDCSTQHRFCWRAKRLTWNGHVKWTPETGPRRPLG